MGGKSHKVTAGNLTTLSNIHSPPVCWHQRPSERSDSAGEYRRRNPWCQSWSWTPAVGTVTATDACWPSGSGSLQESASSVYRATRLPTAARPGLGDCEGWCRTAVQSTTHHHHHHSSPAAFHEILGLPVPSTFLPPFVQGQNLCGKLTQVFYWLVVNQPWFSMVISLGTKFEVSISTHYKDRKGDITVENWVVWGVRRHSRSFEIASFDRAYMSYH